jgi:hypothetical protein
MSSTIDNDGPREVKPTPDAATQLLRDTEDDGALFEPSSEQVKRLDEIGKAIATSVAAFQRFMSDDVPRIAKRFQEIAGAFRESALTMLGAHMLFIRRGYLPSVPLLGCVKDRGVQISPFDATERYATALEKDELVDAAEIMRRLGRVASVGEHELTVRAIFPEIEKVAREETYEVGVVDGITSLPSLRLAVNDLCLKRPGGEAIVAYGKIDLFVLTTISAFDFAYASTAKPGKQPKPETYLYRHAFRKVPNRHRAAHGLAGDYGHEHVVNALTMLYVTTKIGALFVELNERVPASPPKDLNKALKEWRESRRKVSRSFGSLWRSIGGKRGRR